MNSTVNSDNKGNELLISVLLNLTLTFGYTWLSYLYNSLNAPEPFALPIEANQVKLISNIFLALGGIICGVLIDSNRMSNRLLIITLVCQALSAIFLSFETSVLFVGLLIVQCASLGFCQVAFWALFARIYLNKPHKIQSAIALVFAVSNVWTIVQYLFLSSFMLYYGIDHSYLFALSPLLFLFIFNSNKTFPDFKPVPVVVDKGALPPTGTPAITYQFLIVLGLLPIITFAQHLFSSRISTLTANSLGSDVMMTNYYVKLNFSVPIVTCIILALWWHLKPPRLWPWLSAGAFLSLLAVSLTHLNSNAPTPGWNILAGALSYTGILILEFILMASIFTEAPKKFRGLLVAFYFGLSHSFYFYQYLAGDRIREINKWMEFYIFLPILLVSLILSFLSQRSKKANEFNGNNQSTHP